jgi:hypothetical protein
VSERVLGLILAILPSALILISTFLALSESDFNVERALLGDSEQIMQTLNKISSAKFSEENFKIVGIEITEDSSKISLEISSPFEFPILIKEISAEISGKYESTYVRLQEEVELQPESTEIIELVGGGIQPGNVVVKNFKMSFEIMGITIEVSEQ